RSRENGDASPYVRQGPGEVALPFRPGHALVPARYRSDPLVDEFLHALTFIGFGGVEIALGVGRDAVHAVKLARLTSAIAERGDLLERLAHNDADALVLPVRQHDEALLRILREYDVPYRARAARVAGVERLLHESAVRAEDLQAIVGTVADIDEPVV